MGVFDESDTYRNDLIYPIMRLKDHNHDNDRSEMKDNNEKVP